MVGMRIGMVAMIVIMVVMVVTVMMVVMIMSGADTLDMMVMAFLRQTDFILEAEHLGAVFAHLAVHVVAAGEDFRQPVLEHL